MNSTPASELELRRLQEFTLALIEVEAAKIRAATKAAGDGDRRGGGDERNTQDTAQAYMQALPSLAKLERYERRAWSQHRRAFCIYAIAAEE